MSHAREHAREHLKVSVRSHVKQTSTPPASPSLTIWDSATNTNGVLSNSDRTFTSYFAPIGASAVEAKAGNTAGGKYYAEISADLVAGDFSSGFVNSGLWSTLQYIGRDAAGWGQNSSSGDFENDRSSIAPGVLPTTGDIIMLAFDVASTTGYMGLNGTWQIGGSDPVTGTNPIFTNLVGAKIRPAVFMDGGVVDVVSIVPPADFQWLPSGFTAFPEG